MPSFDIVNRIDLQELDNAVNNSKKEIATRYDLRNSYTELTFDKNAKTVQLVAADEMKMEAIREIFKDKCVRRGIDLRALKYGEVLPAAKARLKMTIEIREGIDSDSARKIVKLIKEQKLKVQPAMQDQQVRVTGKKIDDLQAVIQMLKAADLDHPVQFVNMKSG